MNIFDIMGPIMVGPSSSHTAGAARIGLITRRLLGEQPVAAALILHGSFAATGRGHGTDRALVAGLLGLPPDDPRLPQSFVLAREAGMDLSVSAAVIRGAHPNTAILRVENREGRVLEVNAIDGMEATFTGDYPTLIIRNEDKPGQVAEVAGLLSEHGVNIAAMQLYRDRRGGLAVMVIESDQPIPEGMADYLRTLPGIVRCTYLNMGEAD